MIDAGHRCTDPVPREPWGGAQLPLVEMDPDWPGHPPRPLGDEWLWVTSVADLCARFKLDLYQHADIEIVAAANPEFRYSEVEEKLYDYGPQYSMGGMVHGFMTPGTGSGYDIEGRGGAWVRRIGPAPWLDESDERRCGD